MLLIAITAAQTFVFGFNMTPANCEALARELQAEAAGTGTYHCVLEA